MFGLQWLNIGLVRSLRRRPTASLARLAKLLLTRLHQFLSLRTLRIVGYCAVSGLIFFCCMAMDLHGIQNT